MGGRGAASGISDKGKPYGSEYTSLLQIGNIKFVRYNDSTAAKAPMETMTKGRVYVTVDSRDNLKYISYYDNSGKRTKTIDLAHEHKGVSPHAHYGYEHNENNSAKGYANLTTEERKMVDRVKNAWYNRKGK